jgi:hypothetical protein
LRTWRCGFPFPRIFPGETAALGTGFPGKKRKLPVQDALMGITTITKIPEKIDFK